ncbi:hypothetical protein BC831DRAFT_405088 [Entophlyctis helioformis]|nr:hypothetical protein BC831DRAFT_405088 [Entophlyctis helioformis]
MASADAPADAPAAKASAAASATSAHATPAQATEHRPHADALNDLDDKRIIAIRPLIPPAILMEELPLTPAAAATVGLARTDAQRIIHGADDRLLVVVGPCSIHDVDAALEYAAKLKAYADSAADDLCIIMRVYFEKPRTTVGWKGLINDPNLDGTFAINSGLRLSRSLLLRLASLGVPCAVEFLDTISPQFLADLVSWGAIGARTTESQVHRELASGLSVPVGFKNGTEGNLGVAVDAIRAARAPHCFLSVTKQGLSAIVQTGGNDCCHVILRGGSAGPNYDASSVAGAVRDCTKAGVRPAIMIDCSHGNSSKDYRKQAIVVQSIAQQMASDATTADVDTGKWIAGVMIESHLKAGRQDLVSGRKDELVYGMSITDACVSWDETVGLLDTLRDAVRARRARLSAE